jgi:hypothetical protein
MRGIGFSFARLNNELVEMEPARPRVELHGLRGQAAKSIEKFDDRAKRGHHPNGTIVKLDGA